MNPFVHLMMRKRRRRKVQHTLRRRWKRRKTVYIGGVQVSQFVCLSV
jgi:hypothetical protein